MPPLVPKYPRIRLLSPTRRRIALVHLGSPTSEQLHRLGWTKYDGPAKVYDHFTGMKRMDACISPEHDPRNGFIIPGSDPNLTPVDRPAGSIDFNPHVGEIV